MTKLKVPLAARRVITEQGDQMLEIWANARRFMERAPILPYYYSARKPSEVNTGEDEPTLTGVMYVSPEPVIPLSSLTPSAQPWYKVEVQNVNHVRRSHRIEDPSPCGVVAENHLGYVERVLIDLPDYYEAFPNDAPLRFLAFDIEQLTKGGPFPGPSDPLVSIAWDCYTENDFIPKSQDHIRCELADFRADGTVDDSRLVRAFVQAWKEWDPDVVVVYFGHRYDIPRLMERMERLGIDPAELSRTRKAPWIEEEKFAKKTRKRVHVPGRVVFDVWESVDNDQTIYGIKNKQLKTIAEWMKLPAIREDTGNTDGLLRDRPRDLVRYNKNDVWLTRSISRSYWFNFVALAELMRAPLDSVLRASPNFYVTTLQGRAMLKSVPRVVSDGRNSQRFRNLLHNPHCPKKVRAATKMLEPAPVTGARIEIYQTGFFAPLYKVDFGSMYPSIIASLGMGSENVKWIGHEAFGPFRLLKNDAGERTLSLPDEGWKRNHLIRIVGFSPAAAELARLRQSRLDLKAERKALDKKIRARAAEGGAPMSPEEEGDIIRLTAQEDALKRVMNAYYGVHAGETTRYGNLAVGMTVTAIARLLARLVEDVLGDAKVETDTDGVYASAPPPMDAIREAIERFARDQLGLESHFFTVDLDEYKAGFFDKRKVYLLQKKDGAFEKHGAVFKSSKACGLADDILDELIKYLFARDEKGGRDFVLRALKLEDVPIGKFVFRVKPKTPDLNLAVVSEQKNRDTTVADALNRSYGSGTPQGKQVLQSFYRVHNRLPGTEDYVEYVTTRSGYEVPSAPGVESRIDLDYYRAIIRDLAERFGMAPGGKQVKLDGFAQASAEGAQKTLATAEGDEDEAEGDIE